MKKVQKQIIEELREISDALGHSIRRREAGSRLYNDCVKNFGSFNKAKQKARLSIIRTICPPLPKKAFELDGDLAKIAAYLTADGHLCKDLKGFYFASKNIEDLKELEEVVYRKFGINGIYKKGNGYGKCFEFRVFNSRASRLLNSLGVPAGDKMLTPFDVPTWIKENKTFARTYLRTLFYCEGSKYKQSKNTERIKINFNKSEKILEDGINFMNSLKALLKMFNIETSNLWIGKGNLRKRDGETTKQMNISVKSSSNDKFIKEIGWLK